MMNPQANLKIAITVLSAVDIDIVANLTKIAEEACPTCSSIVKVIKDVLCCTCHAHTLCVAPRHFGSCLHVQVKRKHQRIRHKECTLTLKRFHY